MIQSSFGSNEQFNVSFWQKSVFSRLSKSWVACTSGDDDHMGTLLTSHTPIQQYNICKFPMCENVHPLWQHATRVCFQIWFFGSPRQCIWTHRVQLEFYNSLFEWPCRTKFFVFVHGRNDNLCSFHLYNTKFQDLFRSFVLNMSDLLCLSLIRKEKGENLIYKKPQVVFDS